MMRPAKINGKESPKNNNAGIGVAGQYRKTPGDKLVSDDMLKTYGKMAIETDVFYNGGQYVVLNIKEMPG